MIELIHTLPAIRKLARRLADDRRGVSALITAFALTALMGFAGLAVDVVMWEVNLRSMQGAADQSALAGATAYRNAGETGALGSSTTAQNAALATAVRNGYPTSSVTVAAYNNGSYCTNDGCLRVVISQGQTRYFTRVFSNQPVNASARAVATCFGCQAGSYNQVNNGGNPCVMALDASGSGVITDTGGATLSLNRCDLYNNAPNTDATVLNNNASVQGCSVSNPCGSQAFLAQPNNPGGFDVPVNTSAAPAPDPYAGLTPPAPSAAAAGSSCQHLDPYRNPTNSKEYDNVPSGTYCSQDFQNLSQSTVNFANNAVIVINKGLSLQNGNIINGTGVMLYVQSSGSSSQQSNVNASTTMNISAPSSGPYTGIAVWFAGTSQVSYSGQNGSSFSGAIYAPKADVGYSGGNTSASTCTRLIAASITLTGGTNESFDNSGCPAFASPVRAASGSGGVTPYNGAPQLVQ